MRSDAKRVCVLLVLAALCAVACGGSDDRGQPPLMEKGGALPAGSSPKAAVVPEAAAAAHAPDVAKIDVKWWGVYDNVYGYPCVGEADYDWDTGSGIVRLRIGEDWKPNSDGTDYPIFLRREGAQREIARFENVNVAKGTEIVFRPDKRRRLGLLLVQDWSDGEPHPELDAAMRLSWDGREVSREVLGREELAHPPPWADPRTLRCFKGLMGQTFCR